MQAVILAAGESSRFRPLSEGKHKSLLQILGKSILQRTVESLGKAGIKEIIIVESSGSDIDKCLGDGSSFGLDLKYVVQEDAKGMGDAVLQAEKYITGPFIVLNAHHFEISEPLGSMIEKFNSGDAGMVLLGRKTDMPEKYGIVAIDKDVGDRVVNVVEKPAKGEEPSDLRLIGMYLLPRDFFDYYRRVKVHQYAFEDALKLYMTENDARIVITDMETPTLKYPWDLFGILDITFSNMEPHISESAKIDPSAKIEGKVYIGENTRIFENAVIKGPCHIGDNCVIGNNSFVRNSAVEDNVIIGANAEVARSIFMKDTHIHSGFFGDTILGENCRVGAGMITGNVRINRGEIKPVVKGEPVITNMTSLGAVVGHNTRFGIHACVMPGVIVGSNCVVGPNTVVMGNLDSGMVCYSKFENVVKKRK
ncbi:MAG: bifunctional sugar-1-phosphate nucleotidylyltransferase/acetyltransferase [archaeon]|nr:bifunctional sugar-1-phosphate nucleotidylyltransferase/acetyltransferase [archaeon]